MDVPLADDDGWSEVSDDDIFGVLDWVDHLQDVQSRGGAASSVSLSSWHPNAHGGVRSQGSRQQGALQPQSNRLGTLDARVRTGPLRHDEPPGAQLPAGVANAVRENARKEAAGRARVTEKADRATVEQALDPRTRLVLFKMLNQGVFSEINGCVSTGKEANVYHASTAGGHQLAVKVYKTSILVFKDRDRYVSGDWRFRNGYCRHNPRKMVRTWAEKEMRNLARLREAGIFAPEPRLLRAHVLVMDFIGVAGYPAPRLKDADLPASQLRDLYTVLVQDMRTMFQVRAVALWRAVS